MLGLQDFRRLFAVRLTSQAGDGMFQVGLATLFFFSPESAGTATGVATAFAVLLLPFTVVGPWAGVLLDRWRRRQVLLVGNLVRVAITLVLSGLLLTQGVGPAVYVLALVNLSINRFLLSALSAGLPRVVDGPLLLTANALTPTLGAGAAFLGGGIGLVLGLVLEPGRGKDATVLAARPCCSPRPRRSRPGCPAACSVRTSRPTAPRCDASSATSRAVSSHGARHLVARRTPARALGVMAVHRFLYGVVFIAAILMSRNLLAAPGSDGLAVFGSILGVLGVGSAVAVVLTPVLARRTGPHLWIVLCLLVAAVGQLVLVVTAALAGGPRRGRTARARRAGREDRDRHDRPARHR